MTKQPLGYEERLLEVDGEYDYNARSYIFDPIYETPRGFVVTQAIRSCRVCSDTITTTGGPGYRSVCAKCYSVLKLRDFTEGHEHKVEELK